MEEKKSGIKKFFEEFKAFAMRGNVLDMAVGVVIGGAFTAIVTALVEDIINADRPVFQGRFFRCGHWSGRLQHQDRRVRQLHHQLPHRCLCAVRCDQVCQLPAQKPEAPAEPEEPTTKVCPYCQSEISIKAVRCPHCTSKLEGFPEMKA